jgi:DNA-binding transcriptional regulator YdaS (Cro superfamily)
VTKLQARKLISIFGTQSNIARALGIRKQIVSEWFVGKRKIPILYILKLESITEGQLTLDEFLTKEQKCYLKNT